MGYQKVTDLCREPKVICSVRRKPEALTRPTLSERYDPSFIEETGAQGIRGDLAQARAWYERARELGSQAAQEKLRELEPARSVATKRTNE